MKSESIHSLSPQKKLKTHRFRSKNQNNKAIFISLCHSPAYQLSNIENTFKNQPTKPKMSKNAFKLFLCLCNLIFRYILDQFLQIKTHVTRLKLIDPRENNSLNYAAETLQHAIHKLRVSYQV